MRKVLSVIIVLFSAIAAFAQGRGFNPFDSYGHCFEYAEGKKTFAVALDHNDSTVVINHYQKKGKRWKNYGKPSVFPFELFGSDVLADKCDTVALVKVDDKDCLLYSYLTSHGDGEYSYFLSLYGIDDYSLSTLVFTGKDISSGKGGFSPSDFRLEGQSRSEAVGDGQNARIDFLRELMSADGRLVVLSRSDYLSDKYIAWWLESNPRALNGAGTIEFGTISEDCSIYKAFNKAKKDKEGRLEAAVCDVRGYSVVVVKNDKTSSYLLVWAEPACQNRKTDRFLSRVYFQDQNTLALFFYKGKSTFKYRINLHTRTLRR